MADRTFNQIKKHACELAQDDYFPNAFPFFIMKIFFPQLNDDQIDGAISGLGSNDDSIDAYWVDEGNRTVNIAQFKSSEIESEGLTAKKEWFSYLADIETRMLDNNYIDHHRNERIRREIGNDFTFRMKNNYKKNLYLFHLGHSNENTIGHYKNQILYFDYDDIVYKMEEYNSINENTDPAECTVNVDMFENNQASEKLQLIRYNPTNKYSTVVTLISGYELVKLREENKYKLFDRNVRYYLGTSNKINRDIYETAKNKPDNFYYFNNGITITCYRCRDSIVNNCARLKIELPQIINGAQTVNAIYEAYNDMLKKKKAEFGDETKAIFECEKHFKRIKVLCRIIESTKHAETDFSVNLTRYNNSQNSVKLIDFYSNRPEQVELQKKLLKYGYFYERKRGERSDPEEVFLKENGVKLNDLKYKDVQIDLKTLASALQAYSGKTGSSDVGEKVILDENNDDYERLFGRSKTDITNERIREIVLALNIFITVEFYAKKYNQLLKVINVLEENRIDENKYEKFRSLIEDIDFFPNKLTSDLLKYDSYKAIPHDLIDRIYAYRLIAQGKYLITALIHEIMKINEYKNEILSDGRFANMEYIKECITKKWVGKILIKFINPVRNLDKDRRSDNAFFLDSSTFNMVVSFIKDKVYQDEINLEEEFTK